MSLIHKKIIEKLLKIKKRNGIKDKIFLHEPKFNNYDLKIVKDCLKSTYVSSNGTFIKKFCNEIKKWTQTKYVVPVVNGTSAIHLALLSLKVKKDDEVLMPTLNYIASANATRYIGAIPHFVDSEEDTFGVDAQKLDKYLKQKTFIKNNFCVNKTTKNRIKAIIVTHIFGHPAKIDDILKISKKYKLKVIEDSSECLGSYYKKKHLGSFGDIGVLSFNGNKIITTGSGGAIITNDYRISKEVYHLSNIAKKNHIWDYDYDMIGYNYKLANLNAALGYSQFKRLREYLKLKRNLYEYYNKFFLNFKFAYIKKEPKNSKSNYWLQTLVLNKADMKLRNKIINELTLKNIFVRPVWKLIHKLKHFSNYPKMDLSQSLILEKKIINLPSSSHINFKK